MDSPAAVQTGALVSQYGVAKDGWWEGTTGRDVADLGGKDAQILAFYLFKNPDDNMIGLYQARLPIIKERIRTLTVKAIEKAFAVLARTEFAEYDTSTEHVWVRELAKYRLGLYKKPLPADDKRVIHAIGLYERAKDNPFLEPFYRRYRSDLHLPKLRRFRGLPSILGRDTEGAYQGPSRSIAVADSSNSDHLADTDPDTTITQTQKNSLARTERAPVPTTAMLRRFDELHRKHLGVRAVFSNGKDAKLIAALYRSHGGELVDALMQEFFESRDPFIRKAGFTIGVFLSQAGKLIAHRQAHRLPAASTAGSRTGDSRDAGREFLEEQFPELTGGQK